MTGRKHLQFAGLQRKSLTSYRVALERFFSVHKEKAEENEVSAEFDSMAAEYLNCMYREGESLSAGGHLLSGIKRFMPDWRQRCKPWQLFFGNKGVNELPSCSTSVSSAFFAHPKC